MGEISVGEIVERIAVATSDDAIVAALDAGAEAIIEADLIHRLVPFAARLRAVDFSAHPWAALPAGVAMVAVDRAHGRKVLSAARETFEQVDDRRGTGWACFLEGLEDLGEGKLLSAERWWARARELLGNEGPVSTFSELHMCLAAYARGDLRRAQFLAERVLHDARRRADARVEAIAQVELALFRWWLGDFRGVERAGRGALASLRRLAEPLDRYEEPIAHLALGAVAHLRGDVAAGESSFTEALDSARRMKNEWYQAIVLTARAEVSAAVDPERALRDARAALDYYERVGEEWWAHWALEAYVVAEREHGDLRASVAAARELLDRVDNPLERGRALLELATSLARLGGHDEDVSDSLAAARDLLELAGARYLVARTELQLASVHRGRAAYLLRDARRHAGTEADDPAWRRLFRGAPMRVRLLGLPQVQVNGVEVVLRTRHELEALAMLALAGSRGCSAERMCDALWPDADRHRGTHRLDGLLSTLRQALLPATRIERAHGVVRLDLDEDECDVRVALAALDGNGCRDGAIAALARPLLGGSNREWVVEEQGRIDALREACVRAN